MNWADKMIGTDLIDWKYAALYNIIILLRCSKFFLFISCIYIQFGSLMLLMGSLDVYIYIYDRFIFPKYMYIYSITQ